MKPTTVYWSAVLVGFAIVLWIYWRSSGGLRERFEDAAADPAAAPAATPPAPTGRLIKENGKYLYIESLAAPAFPSRDALKVYLTSFSDKTENGARPAYSAADARWYNFVDPEMIFSITSANGVPQTVRSQGLGIKNAVLNGPSSAIFKDPSSSVPYELPPFSVVWFAKNVGYAADETQPGMLFKLFGQSPNYMEVYLRPAENAPDAMDLFAKLGDKVYKMSEAPIPATTLAVGGNPTVYAFTYKKCTTSDCSDGELTFYIGATAYRVTMTPPPTTPIVLANHNVQVNTNGNLDAQLYAFAFYNATLTAADVAKLTAYFNAELSNYNMTNLIAQQLADQNAAANAATDAAAGEALSLADKLAQCQATAAQLKASAATDADTAAKHKWFIDPVNGTSMVSLADVEQCSLLTIRKPGAKVPPVAPPPAPPAAAPTPPTTPPAAPPAAPAPITSDWWKIAYTDGMADVTAKAPPAEATGTIAAPPPKTAGGIWAGLYQESLKQEDKNLDAAKAAAADTGAKTSPVAPVAVQDPAKTTAAAGAAPTEEPGFFQQLLSAFK